MASSGVGRASAIMAAGTVVSRLLGFVKVMVLGYAIGVTSSVSADTFALGNLLPSIVNTVLIGGVLNAILVPQILQASRAEDGGAGYINKIVTLASTVLLGLTLIVTVAAPILVAVYATDMKPDEQALATAFAYWCLPQVFFLGLYAVLGQVLNARSAFGPYSWAPVLNNVVAIGGMVVYIVVFGADPQGQATVKEWTPAAIATLAGSATAGVVAQAVLLFFFWRSAGLRYRPDFRWRGAGLGRAGKIAGWSFGMIIVMQVGGIVTNNVAVLASGNGPSVAALQYAWLIFMLPYSVLAMSIGTAYFTRLSKSAAEGDLRTMRIDLSSSARVINLAMVVSAAMLGVLAMVVSRVLQFGASEDAVTELGWVIVAYMVGLVPYGFLYVLQRGFYALNDTRTPFFFTAFQIVLVVALSLLCILLPLEFVGAGLALAFSVSTIAQTLLASWLLSRKMGGIDGRRIGASLVQCVLAGIVAVVAGVSVLSLLTAVYPDLLAVTGVAALGASLVASLVVGAVVVVVYIVGLRLLGNRDIGALISVVRSRLGR